MKFRLQQLVAIFTLLEAYGHIYGLRVTSLAWWGWMLLGVVALRVYGRAYHKLEVSQ